MNIHIPIRGASSRPEAVEIARAQLYNLDDDEKFNFQFNPRIIEPVTEYNWSDSQWTGSDRIHSQFLGTGQAEFEITAEFVVDPGAPKPDCECEPSISDSDGLVIIENVITVLEKWGSIRQDKGRPSLIGFIMGETIYTGRMTNLAVRHEELFSDGRLRKATIRIGFKQWRTLSRSR